MSDFLLDSAILILGFVSIHYLFNFGIKFFSIEFRDYLQNSQRLGYFNLKIITFLFLVYFFYQHDIINIDSLFFTSDKVKHFFAIPIIKKLISSFEVIYFCKIVLFLFNSFNDFLKLNYIKKIKRINTIVNNYIKVINFFIIVFGGVLLISIWLGISVLSLIAGLSTASVVVTLLFRDFILGVIASIISANSNIARIGDYIVLEKHHLSGTITDIAITNIKIRADNGDIISFPSYWLLNDIVSNHWEVKDYKVKFLELEFFVSLSGLSKIDMYDLEQLIINHKSFTNHDNLVIDFKNDKYNFGSVVCSFFLSYKDHKNYCIDKIDLYNQISNYLGGLDILIEKTSH